MTASTFSLSLWIFFSLLSHYAFDDEVEVSCDLKASCVLPCSFQAGPEPVVNWERPGQRHLISRYHHGKDHGARHKDYRDRTSVFVSEITEGNASLLLKEVRVQDEGLYWCWTSTMTSIGRKKTPIRLSVRAPVVHVDLTLTQTELLCLSWNIYPRPDVTWTFSPERLDKPQTDISSSSETGLFSVLSSVPLTLSSPHEYICNISTEHSWRSATYRRTDEIHFSDSVTVPCTEPSAPVRKLEWKFNNRETILTKSGSEPVYTVFWRPFVDGLTESNSLVLKDLTQHQLGLFSCEVVTETEKFIIETEVTGTKPVPEGDTHQLPVLIAVPLMLTFVITGILALFLWRFRKALVKREQPDTEEQVSNERAAPEPAPKSKETLPELEGLTTGNIEDNDVGSSYSSGTASRPESYLFEESSGYGHSTCDYSTGSSSSF